MFWLNGFRVIKEVNEECGLEDTSSEEEDDRHTGNQTFWGWVGVRYATPRCFAPVTPNFQRFIYDPTVG